VSTWGPGLFSDDTTCDVRDEYRALIEDGVDDEAAARQIVEGWTRELAPDELDSMWLALAVTQSKFGRLQPGARDRALAAIDREYLVDRWTAVSPKDGANRRKALGRARAVLVGPQPSRKRLRRPARHVTDLEVGDLLADASTTPPVLWLVVSIYDQRESRDPWIRRLAWSEDHVPDAAQLERLTQEPTFPAFHPGARAHLAGTSKTSGDWADAGLTLIARCLRGAADPRAEYMGGSAGEWDDLPVDGWE
jgi:hypothetical protein